MMSRRFKLSHELSKITISNPEIIDNDMDKEDLIHQSNQNQDLESLLKEALEESNPVFENLGKTSSESSQKEDLSEMEEEIVISEYIKPMEDITEIPNILTSIEEESEKKLNIKDDSDQEYDSILPKKGDLLRVKYSDGWHKGRLHSISKKKTYFWVEFKGFEDLYKVKRTEKYQLIKF